MASNPSIMTNRNEPPVSVSVLWSGVMTESPSDPEHNVEEEEEEEGHATGTAGPISSVGDRPDPTGHPATNRLLLDPTLSDSQKVDCLKTLRVVVRNLLDPARAGDTHYQTLLFGNTVLQERLWSIPGAREDLLEGALGFEPTHDGTGLEVRHPDPEACRRMRAAVGRGLEALGATASVPPLPPPCERVLRGNDDDDSEKICRICLDDGDAGDMIAPCACSGGSRWVHRECLDRWRILETDRAFSRCTECLSDYQMEPIGGGRRRTTDRKRAIAYGLLVSRDLFFATVTLLLPVLFVAAIVYACDRNERLPELLGSDRPLGVYCLAGFLGVLVISGILGAVRLCGSGCSVKEALAPYQVRAGPSTPQASYADRAVVYQTLRQQRRQPFAAPNNQCCNDLGFACHYGCCDQYDACFYCCLCCRDNSFRETTFFNPPPSSGNGDGCGCDCDCSGCCDGCDGEAIPFLLPCLLVAAVVLACWGVFVGAFVSIIVFRRTVQRHAHLLHKRELAQEFRVKDLSGDAEQPTRTAKESAGASMLLHEDDAIYLRNLGLMV